MIKDSETVIKNKEMTQDGGWKVGNWDPGIEPVSPALQADSLSAEPSGSPGWGVRSCISNIAPPSPPWFPTGDAEPASLGTTRWGARQTEQPFSCGQQSLNCTAWREA